MYYFTGFQLDFNGFGGQLMSVTYFYLIES